MNSNGSLFPSSWSETDRNIFFESIRRLGSTNVEAIAERLKDKTRADILEVKEKFEALSFWCSLPEKYRRQDAFLTSEAEELDENDVVVEESSATDRLQSEEESFITCQESERVYYSSTAGLLNPTNLLRYSDRIYCELFPERGRRSLFISGHTLHLLDRCIRDYVGELLKEVVRKASLSRRYKVDGPVEFVSAVLVHSAARMGKNRDVKRRFTDVSIDETAKEEVDDVAGGRDSGSDSSNDEDSVSFPISDNSSIWDSTSDESSLDSSVLLNELDSESDFSSTLPSD